MTKIHNDFIKPTGDPFIDVGGYVIQHLGERFPDKSIFELIEYATNVYVNLWDSKLSAYFLNHPVTQNSFNTKEKKINETLKYYRSILEGSYSDFKIGFCRILGLETKLYLAGRNNHLMSGSGAFVNFHSAYENGLYMSKESLVRSFFVPLGVCQVGKNVALLQSNFDKVSSFLVAKNLNENLKNINSGIAEGTLKSEFGIISNALFGYADACLGNLAIAVDEDDDEIVLRDVQLNMYHFTNFGASPDIELHTFTNLLFKFYAHCKKNYSKEWNAFVNQHYTYSKFKDAQFDEQSQEWYNKNERLSYLDYKVWYNPILNNLLENIPIIGYLRKWSKKHKFSFEIIEIYCLNILKMKTHTINKIKELADFIIQNKSDSEIEKAIKELNSFGKTGIQPLRQFLIKLIRENYLLKNSNTLLTIEDYVFYLFSEGTNWKEIRDLLLIAIYQRLHETSKQIDVPEVVEDEEEN